MARTKPRAARVTVNWPGKHAFVPRAAELECHEHDGGEADVDAGWTDKLVQGDNLDVASALLRAPLADEIARAGGVKLVYLDPPFGVGVDFDLDRSAWSGAPGLAFRDRFGDESSSAIHVQWLYERLQAAHALLADDGAIYLHVDWRAAAEAKLMLDEIFGVERFCGWIAWKSGSGAKSRARWSQEHQDILCFRKGDEFRFRRDVPALREPFAETSRRMHFGNLDAAGRRFRSRVVNGKEYRYFEDQGRAIGSVWTDCPSMTANSPISREAVGWPTQKPEALIERILEASSRPGDLVLDMCSGSGTWAAVARRLDRRWIVCDVSALSVHTARKRLLAIQGSRGFDVLRARGGDRAPNVTPNVRLHVEARFESSAAGRRVGLERVTARGPTLAEVESELGRRERALAIDGDALVALARDGRGRIAREPVAAIGLDLVDAWGIAVDPREGAPRIAWQAMRRRRGAELARHSSVLPADARMVLVRVVSTFGGETDVVLTVGAGDTPR